MCLSDRADSREVIKYVLVGPKVSVSLSRSKSKEESPSATPQIETVTIGEFATEQFVKIVSGINGGDSERIDNELANSFAQ